jgi:RNA polymerase sigma-70 factor, ECF subfamily
MNASDLEPFRAYLLLLAEQQVDDKLRARVAASDIVQQTMLEAHRNRAAFRGQTSGEQAAWLRQILARNLADAGKHERAAKRDIGQELNQASADLAGWCAANQSSPSQRAVREEDAVRLAAALMDLPDAQRDALVLQHWHGLTLAQIGEILDKSPVAVAGLLKRGLRRLRELLDEKT